MGKKVGDNNTDTLPKDALIRGDEQPYNLPKNWEWTYLLSGAAECLDRFREPVNANERARRKGNIPYYGATGQVGWIDDFLTDEELVLLGEDGAPFLDPLKNKAYMIFGKAWVNNHAHILRSFYDSSGNKYLMHYLNQFNYEGYVSGTTRLKLTRKSMERIPVPLPPLSEQKRIVKKLESMLGKLKEARELIREARETFVKRRAAILHKAFTGELTKKWREENKSTESQIETIRETPFTIPKTWRWTLLQNVCSKPQYGTSAKSHKTGKVPVVRMGNIQNGIIEWDDLVYTSDKAEIEKYKLHYNDVLFNRTNSPELVGKTAIYKNEMPAIFAGYLIRIKTLDTLNPDYLNYFLNSPYAKHKCSDVKTDGVSQSNINSQKLGAFEIPIPPIKEQQEIVKLLECILSSEKEALRLADLEEQIDLIEKSILSKAFCGQLGTNDPNDELAEKLLARALANKAEKDIQPKRKSTGGKVIMAKITLETVNDAINQFPKGEFDFEELRSLISGDYDELKEAIFALLDGTKPRLKQLFDKKTKKMQFKRQAQ